MSHQRQPMRNKDAKRFLNAFAQVFPSAESRFKGRSKIEESTVRDKIVLWIDDMALIIKSGDEYFPTLYFKEVIEQLPKVVVDMGAVPHVVNGADIMSPGIREIQGEFTENAVVVVVDEKFGKPLAIGRTLLGSTALRATKQGKAITNVHYVGDEVWESTKTA